MSFPALLFCTLSGVSVAAHNLEKVLSIDPMGEISASQKKHSFAEYRQRVGTHSATDGAGEAHLAGAYDANSHGESPAPPPPPPAGSDPTLPAAAAAGAAATRQAPPRDEIGPKDPDRPWPTPEEIQPNCDTHYFRTTGCPDHYVIVANPRAKACNGTCTEAECCNARCSTYECPTGWEPNEERAEEDCKSNPCFSNAYIRCCKVKQAPSIGGGYRDDREVGKAHSNDFDTDAGAPAPDAGSTGAEDPTPAPAPPAAGAGALLSAHAADSGGGLLEIGSNAAVNSDVGNTQDGFREGPGGIMMKVRGAEQFNSMIRREP